MTLHQFLTEKVLHECWHEGNPEDEPMPSCMTKCIKCNKQLWFDEVWNRDFSTPADWWYLWDELKRMGIWPKLFTWIIHEYTWIEWESLSLLERAEAIARFFGWEEEGD